MTGQEVLETLLARLNAAGGSAVLLMASELAEWPKSTVAALTATGLVRPASTARSVTCEGCEEFCTMPVTWLDSAFGPAAYVACDRPPDMGLVPVAPDQLERWQVTGDALAHILAEALRALPRPGIVLPAGSWEIGTWRRPLRAEFVMVSGEQLAIEVAGHQVVVADVLLLETRRLQVDIEHLKQLVVSPGRSTRSPESVPDVDARTVALIMELQGKVRNPIETAAAQLGVSRQIINKRKRRHEERIGVRASKSQKKKPM